jgi:hypothetical protein
MAGNSIIDLFAIGKTSWLYYLRVIEALHAWVAGAKTGAHTRTWLDVFVRLAREAKHPQPPGPAWPAVLWIYDNFLESGDHACQLLQLAIGSGATRTAALGVLQSWLRFADNLHAAAPTLASLVAGLFAQGNRHEQERLRFWMLRWANDPKQPCTTAAQLLPLVGVPAQAKEAGG